MGIFIFLIFVFSSVYMHYRGQVRHSFKRQLTSHSNLTAPYNVFTYLLSKIPNTPYIDKSQFESARIFDSHWEIIREEAKALYAAERITKSDAIDDLAFNSFFRTGWGRFYLKWYDDFLPSALEHCPKTIELIKKMPDINAAMFASLPPGAKLVPHRDPFAGSLRYHLGLFTPNSEDCHIFVDGEKYYWKDGESVMFDETYIHAAENNTDEPRVILFCDINRPLRYSWANTINRLVCSTVIKASSSKNIAGEKVGVLNHIFKQLYKLRNLGRSLKKWNRKLYYIIKYFLYFGLVYLIFF